MPHRIVSLLAAAGLAVGVFSAAASAGEDGARPTYIKLGAGYYDLTDDEQAAEFDLSVQPDWVWSVTDWWDVGPHAGVLGTTDAALYGYAGILFDFKVTDWFYITPSTAAGLYKKGDGKDLGNTVEFRSGVDFNYQFENEARLGLGIYHISNAGLGTKNPGVETLQLSVSIPVGHVN